MRLKSQRQLLIVGIAVLAALSALLAVLMAREATTPEAVALGEGRASVESMPVAELEPVAPQPTAPTTPTGGESPMAPGNASFYGNELAGNRTASGELFDPQRLTAAHRTLPLGSRVRVTNPDSGDSVIVRINDRGPYHGNRVIDLSYAAAREIGLIASGSGRVNMALIV